MGTDKESGWREEQVESSILNQSVSLPHVLNTLPGLSDEEALVYLLLIIHKAGFDLTKLAAGEITTASSGGVATDEDGYFTSPGVLVLAQAMGCTDARAASVPLKHLEEKEVIARRAAGRLHSCDEICILALAGKANQHQAARSFVGDGAQTGGSSIPLRLIFDPRLRRLRLAPRLYALLLQCASGAEGVAFPATATIAALLSTKAATVRVVEAAIVAGGYIAELQRGLQESKVRFFPKGRDVGNPAWSQLLGRCRYADLFRAGILSVGAGGKLRVGDTSYANLCRLVAEGKLHPRPELSPAEVAERGARARAAQVKSVEKRVKNKASKAVESVPISSSVSADQADEGDVAVTTLQQNSRLDQQQNSRQLQQNSRLDQQQNDAPTPALQPNSKLDLQSDNQQLQQNSRQLQQNSRQLQQNSKLGQQPDSNPNPHQNSLPTHDLQQNSRLDQQPDSNRIDSDSDSDNNKSESESESNIAGAPARGPLAEAHAIVRQISLDYGERPDGNRTQLCKLWLDYERTSGGELTPELFLLMVKEVDSYVRSLPAARIKANRPAAFMVSLKNNLQNRGWLRLKRRESVGAAGTSKAAVSNQPSPSSSVPASAGIAPVTVRVPQPPPPAERPAADTNPVPEELRPTAEDKAVWHAALDIVRDSIPERAWRYYKGAKLLMAGGYNDGAGQITSNLYVLAPPVSREGETLAKMTTLDVAQVLAELTDCAVRLEVAGWRTSLI